jgi:hypothetical protein
MILAMIVLAFGSLMIAGLLSYVNGSVQAHALARDRLEARYAADAGVEWLAAELLSDPTPYQSQGTVTYDGEPINGHSPAITMTADYSPNDPTTGTDTYYLTSSADGVTVTATIEHRGTQVRVEDWDYS